MAKIVVLGSSAVFPLPRTKTNNFKDYLDIIGYQRNFELHDDLLCNSAKKDGKDKRTRACIALIQNGKTILFDAGPDIKVQLKKYRLKPDVVFITHEHPDANYGLRYLKNVKIFSEKQGNIKLSEPVDIFGVTVLPFRVEHSKIAPATGYKVTSDNKGFVYITDMSSVAGVGRYFKDSDILFADGSILERNLPGHLSMANQLKIYKKWRLKRVIFTHIGHDTLPYNNLVKYLKGRYQYAEVAYDGMVIRI